MDFHPFDGLVDDPKNMSTLVFESLVFGLVAIILGTIIDKLFNKINEKTDKKLYKYLISILQIIISAVVIGLIYLYGPTEFAHHFQATIPGMTFPALYYGVQSNIYKVWQM